MNQLTALYSAVGNSLDVTPEQRVNLIEVTLARKLAFSLPLPSEQVDSTSTYFSTTCANVVRLKVSAFNEQFPINVIAVMDMAKSFWEFRYSVVHPRNDELESIIKMCVEQDCYNSLKACLPPVHIAALKGTLPAAATAIIDGFVAV
jgi:hypothetical protein